jgi:hypothetical protein
MTCRLIRLVVIVIEGKLKTRSSAHGVSYQVNTLFSGKSGSLLAFQIPLSYTAVHIHYFRTPILIWRTLCLQIRGGSCTNVLEAHTNLYPEETVLIMTRLWTKPIPVAPWSIALFGNRSLAVIAVLNPASAWMCVSCQCCVLSGRFLCNVSISRPEESYRVLCRFLP